MKTVIWSLVISSILISCVQKNIEIPKKENNFYALSVGNSWVYKYYKDGGNGDYSVFTNRTDSVSIIGKESFNGKMYYKFQTIATQIDGNNLPESYDFYDGVFVYTNYLRDSLGYLIDKNGYIKYWNQGSEERFVHSTFDTDIYRRLNQDLSNIEVEAGEFECLNMEFFIKETDNTEEIIISNFYYANGVGKIEERLGFIADGYTLYEKRLNSFIIN